MSVSHSILPRPAFRQSSKRVAAMKARKTAVIELSDVDEGYDTLPASNNDCYEVTSDNEDAQQASVDEVDENGNLRGFIDDEAMEDDDDNACDDAQVSEGEQDVGADYEIVDDGVPGAGRAEDTEMAIAYYSDDDVMIVDQRASRFVN